MAGELEAMIRFLAQIMPNWLTIADNPEGQILRMKRQESLDNIRELLRNHFNK
jgi:hypothetical protein